jgi:serine/threonine protein kinase
VRIYDIGEHEGLLYIVMEYVDGRALSDLLAERGRFPLPELVPLVSQFADALAYVHSHGVLHRDIKPNNILVDRQRFVKLMDFGIARIFHSAGSMGTIVGTPAYMAPEQMAGEPVSQATDVFSAGAMIYELLTGKRPFRGLSVVDRMREQPPPAHTIAKELPAGVSEVLQRCLLYRPTDRYQSIHQLTADLRQFLPQSGVRPTREVALPEIGLQHKEAAPRRPGRTLGDLITNEPPDLPAALRRLRHVLERVARIHADGSHALDLSPDRISIGEDGAVEVDWVHDATAATGTLAAANAQYNAPEAFKEQGLLSPRDRKLRDVYVLGMVAHEVLLGRQLFREQFRDVAAEGPIGWMRWHLDPGRKPVLLAESRPEIPKSLSEAVAAMVAKDPSKRPSELKPLIAEMDRVIEKLDRTVPETPRTREVVLPAPDELKKSRHFPRWAMGLAALPLVASAAVAVWWFVLPVLRSRQPPTVPSAGRSFIEKSAAEKKTEGKSAAAPQDQQELTGRKPMSADPELPKSVFFPSGDMLLVTAAAPPGPLVAYYLDRYEVTNAAYRRFCQETNRNMLPAPDWDKDYVQKDNYPVLNVSWADAAAFAAWAGKRLPTEPEWEHAARGNEKLQFPWGNAMDASRANLAGTADGHAFTAPAGAMFFDLSPFGIADVLGNVAEWVDGEAPAGFRVMKSSSFTVEPGRASLSRRVTVPEHRNPADFLPVGFRCALDSGKLPASATGPVR